jgi:hypothetical protein
MAFNWCKLSVIQLSPALANEILFAEGISRLVAGLSYATLLSKKKVSGKEDSSEARKEIRELRRRTGCVTLCSAFLRSALCSALCFLSALGLNARRTTLQSRLP